MKEKNSDAQFSIYKVNFERAHDFIEEEQGIDINDDDKIYEQILKNIKEKIINKSKNFNTIIKNKNFYGFVFNTVHIPTWDKMIMSLFEDDLDKVAIVNSRVSYILFYKEENNVFILTGGLGSSYITDYIDRNYGLFLLPKIIKKDNPVIRAVLENSLYGNRMATQYSLKNSSTINIENELSKIYREMSIELNKDLIVELGIESEIANTSKKVINVDVKESLVIKKSISLQQLKNILNRLVSIEKRENNFTLGFLVQARKYDYKNEETNELLINYFKERKYENFTLVGDNYLEYCTGGSKYVIENLEDINVFKSESPIKIGELICNLFKERTSSNKVKDFLKYKLYVYDNGNNLIMGPIKIKESLQGFIENESGEPFLLYRGDWFIFDKKYTKQLTDDYINFYNYMNSLPSSLKFILGYNQERNEDTYNKYFKSSKQIIFAHTVLIDNIEIADLIYYNNSDLYLIHNKGCYDGAGSRDVFEQIEASSNFINNNILYKKKEDFFKDYYNKIKEKCGGENLIDEITSDEFVNLFKKLKIHYVAGFMNGKFKNTKSNYVRYTTICAYKKLSQDNHDLIVFKIND